MTKYRAERRNDGGSKSTSLYKDDKRLGFADKRRIPDAELPDTRWKTRYGVGVDNLPFSGESLNELNTLLGKLDYSLIGNKGYAGFTPNLERTKDFYLNGEGKPWMLDYATSRLGGDALLQAGRHGSPIDPRYFISAALGGDKQVIPDFDKTFNSPFGSLELESNYEAPNSVDATFNPNDYVQAIIRLMNSMNPKG